MTNDKLFIMKKGSKPGDTPTLGTNVYYDTATNPLVICDDDTIDDAATIACYEVRNDWVLPLKGIRTHTSGVAVDNGSGYATSVDTINVDGGDPRDLLEVGWHTYKSDGTFIGTIKSMAYDGTHGTIVFTTNIQTALANNDVIHRAWGVSNSKTYNVLNRIYPNDSTSVDLYLENLNNTPGYRIDCASYKSDGSTLSTGVSLASLDIATNDYFVMINNLDPLKHHIAKITEITTNDVAGDSFEFSPKYGSEIPKGTKFAIYKGPLVTDTGVVAVGYGLYGNTQNYGTDSDETDGTGTATDARHAGLTQISAPNFYFYNDRLNKKNELNHNTKYMLHYSRTTSAATHYFRAFLTCQDYGLKVVDYGPYTMNATLTDKSREFDSISSTPQSTDHYSASVSETYTVDVEDWDRCFTNNKRNTKNLIRQWSNNRVFTATSQDANAYPEGTFTGPTRYLHYTTSPNACSSIPDVLEMEVFDSINESGSYVDMVIADAKRIYGRKLKQHDKITIKKIIGRDNLDENFKALPGKWSGNSGGTDFTVELDTGQDLRILLQKTTASGTKYETFLIGNYYYFITGIDAPVNANIRTQSITIGGYKGKTDAEFVGGGTIQETFTDSTGYRRAWSVLTESLLTDVSIDTDVTYSNIGTATQSSTITYANQTISSNNSRLYNSELLLQGGYLFNYSIPIEYGDKTHKILKLQSPRKQMYQDETLGNESLLEYFIGDYAIMKTIFVGRIESLEDYIEQGMFKYKLSGRGNINKLLGPIVNKDYKHTEDIIYSTYGPIFNMKDSGYDVNLSTGAYAWSPTPVIFDGSGSWGSTVKRLLFKQDGNLLGNVSSTSSNQLNFVGASGALQTSVDNNDSIYEGLTDRNIISLSKSLEANPTLNISPLSLRGTAGKGLIFTSGQKLDVNDYGVPTTELSTLVGTSAHSHSRALGYNIHNPQSVNEGVDLPFMFNVKDEVTTGGTFSKINTVNSLTEYEVVSIDSGVGSSIIEIAPNCPVIMGRVDDNPNDVRFETLTATTINPDDNYAIGHNYAIEVNDNYSNTNSAINGKYIYNSAGILLGKVLNVIDDGDSGYGCLIILDRPLTVAITTSTLFYTSTSKTHGLYLINTQGLRNGGILQLTNSILNTLYQPTIFNLSQTPDGTHTLDALNRHYCAVDRYGSYFWRYLDLQKGKKGSISYAKRQNISGDLTDIYSAQLGEFNAYAPAFRFNPGSDVSLNLTDFNYDSDYSNDYQKMGSHETRNVFPVLGSNFADYDKYSSNSATHPTGYNLIPKKYSTTLGGPWNIDWDGAVWDSTAIRKVASGIKANAVKATRDRLELIDPKVITPFLFTTADLFPDSLTRTNHIGNVERDFSNYSIMLKSKPTQIKSSTEHDKYVGKLNQLELSDDSYETLLINSASIKTNQMRRLGLMRLTEITFDWHFNMIDPENIKEKDKNNVPFFKYARYQKVTDSSETISSISGAVITCTNSVTASKFPDGSYVFDSNGNYLGTVNSSGVSGSNITLTADVKLVNGAAATGNLYYIEKGHTNNQSYYEYFIGGKDGDDSFTNFTEESANSTNDADDSWGNTPRPLNMLQMAIFNGYGSCTETLNESTSSAEEANNEGYGASDSSAFKKYFIRKMDMAANGNHEIGYLNHITLPPVFEGFVLEKLYQAGSSGTRLRPSGSGSYISGTTIATNGASQGDIQNQLKYGDKIYTDNGEFVGTFASVDASAVITIVENLNTTTTLNRGGDDATFLCKGGTQITDYHSSGNHIDIATGKGGNESGGHALSSKEHVAKYSYAATASTIPDAEYVHPSRVLEGIFNFFQDTRIQNPYANLRAVALTRHKVENSGGKLGWNVTEDIKPKIGAGMSALLGSVGNGGGLDGEDKQQQLKIKVGSDLDYVQQDYPPMFIAARLFDSHTFPDGFSTHDDFRGEFAKFTRTKSATGQVFKNRGEQGGKQTLCDGGEFVFKPIFNTQGTNTSITYDTTTPNGSSMARIRIRPDTDGKMAWLAYSPNLTGCYLVSTDAKEWDSTDVSSDNLFSDSTHNRIPKYISYIISHEISRTDSIIYHDFIVDNMGSATKQNNYKIMRPNHVCFYPESPNEIDLYKLDYSYTKRADSNEMYSRIPHLRYWEDGWKHDDVGEPDYGEGIQSMYVVINPDHTSTEKFLIPRVHTGGYTHDDLLFGSGKTFEEGSYDMLASDGVNKERKTLNISKSSGWGSQNGTTIRFNEKFDKKMSGVVSLGEIFSIETATPVSLQNVESATIGTGVTIGEEVEDIVNDILETNSIVYTKTDREFPYVTAPNIQGADVYNSVKYLGTLKDKELSFNKDKIEFIPKDYTYRQSNIELSETNSDIQVVELSRNKSGFDIYNEIIVYGHGVKSTKRDSKSIKEIGKKTLEEFDDKLMTQPEVDERARGLLQLHSADSQRITFRVSEKNLELLQSGDIITVEWPSQHIPRSNFIVLEIRHSINGLLEIEAGSFKKGLEGTLAQMIVQQKKVDSFLRSDRFKAPVVDEGHFESFRVKPIKLVIKKTSTSGSTQIGLTTALGFTTTLDIGTTTVTEELNEDYT